MARLASLRRGVKQAVILLVAAGLPAVVASLLFKGEAAGDGEMLLAVALRHQPPPLWIDARPAAEYDRERVPGALALRQEEWETLVPQVLARWQPEQTALVYCDSAGSQASREVAERLREYALGPVYVLHGGWKAWKQK